MSVATTYGLTNPSTTNNFPIVDSLSLISVEIVFNRLSNGQLYLADRKDDLGIDYNNLNFILELE